jgi:tetratricopeptide (TPR) repeat protein
LGETLEVALAEAYNTLRTLVEVYPDDARGWVALGRVCLMMKKYDEAIENAHEALNRLGPDEERDVRVNALDMLREAHFGRGEIEASFELREQVFEANPSNTEMLEKILDFNMYRGEFQKGIHFVDIALGVLQEQEKRTHLFLVKATCLSELQQYDAAIETLEQAIAEGIDDQQINDALAKARELQANFRAE